MFISDDEAIRYILLEKDRFACYLGAGASVEAGVKSAWDICTEIRDDLLEHSPLRLSQDEEKIEQWANAKLNWHKPDERYATVIRVGYPNQDVRVQYFRRILRNVRPSFSHHAVAEFQGGLSRYRSLGQGRYRVADGERRIARTLVAGLSKVADLPHEPDFRF